MKDHHLVFLAFETYPAELPPRTDFRQASGHVEAALARMGDRWLVLDKPGFMPAPMYFDFDNLHDALKRHAQAVARVRKAAQPFSWAALERDRLDRQIAQLTAKRERL